jgi:uncharacterized membrane protein
MDEGGARVDTGRLEALSDGVFAVALTLLALSLVVAGPGHGSLAHQYADRWPSFVAYVVSFFTIGIIWVNHHALFKSFGSIDRVMIFLNLVLLFFVVVIPFATTTMATYLRRGGADAHLAAAVYELVFEAMSLAFCLVFWWAIRRGLLVVPPAQRTAAIVRFGIGNVAYVIAIAMAFISPVSALAISALVALYYVFERTPNQPAETESEAPPLS